jgi:hypothetical protein
MRAGFSGARSRKAARAVEGVGGSASGEWTCCLSQSALPEPTCPLVDARGFTPGV